jgi:tetraacyldisaccharide 4'-kinase
LAQQAPLPDHADASAYGELLARWHGPLICTEKDAVKLSALLSGETPASRQRIWVAPLELCPEPGFFAAVDGALGASSARRRQQRPPAV